MRPLRSHVSTDLVVVLRIRIVLPTALCLCHNCYCYLAVDVPSLDTLSCNDLALKPYLASPLPTDQTNADFDLLVAGFAARGFLQNSRADFQDFAVL